MQTISILTKVNAAGAAVGVAETQPKTIGVNMEAGIFSMLVFLGICILMFLILRALILWYWRVNDSICFLEWQKDLLVQHFDQNKEIIRLLRKIAGEQAVVQGVAATAPKNAAMPVGSQDSKQPDDIDAGKVVCNFCQSKNMPEATHCCLCKTLLEAK